MCAYTIWFLAICPWYIRVFKICGIFSTCCVNQELISARLLKGDGQEPIFFSQRIVSGSSWQRCLHPIQQTYWLFQTYVSFSDAYMNDGPDTKIYGCEWLEKRHFWRPMFGTDPHRKCDLISLKWIYCLMNPM